MSKLAMLFGITVALFIYGGANLYVGHHLYVVITPLFPPFVSAKLPVFACLYGFLALLLLFPFFSLPRRIRMLATWIGSYWMGLFVYLLLGFLAADAVLLAGVVVQIVPWPVPADVSMWAWLLAVIAAVGLSAYGLLHARRLHIVRYEVQLGQSAGFGGSAVGAGSGENAQNRQEGPFMKVVVISDLHLGAVHAEKRFEGVVARILEMKPDMVLIPGDLFNDDITRIRNPQRVQRMFRLLAERTPCGVFASLGNHDGGRTFPQMAEFLREGGVTLLMEDCAVVDGPLGRLVLVGRLDPSPIGGYGSLRRKPTPEVLADARERAPGAPLIVLDHTPIRLEQYDGEADVALIVSGHTHKGQIFPNNLITRRMYEVDYGHFRRNENSPHVIVTSGAGTWGMPMRVGSDCEVVEIVLV